MQAQLVDESGVEQRVDERAAAGDQDRPAVLLLEPRDRPSTTSPASTVVLFHSGSVSVVETTTLGIVFILSANGALVGAATRRRSSRR